MTLRPTIVLTLLALAGSACAQTSTDGLQQQSFVHDGRSRTYFFHMPPRPRVGRLPVLFALHGGGRNGGAELSARTGYNALADREGFLVVYPEGVDSQWNDGRGASFRGGDVDDVDDVGFMSALFDRVIQRHRGDPRRLYVTGLSNGGMMTLRLGVELSERIAAIAPVIGNLPVNLAHQDPAEPLPVLIMNGTEDPLVPYRGGPVTVFGDPYGQVLSTPNTVLFWTRNNGGVTSEARRVLPDLDANDGSRVVVHDYTCADAPVVLYAIHGGGHSFPGSDVPDRPRFVGNKNKDVDGPEVVWAFLRQFRRAR